MKFQIKDILPNPFRNLESYPIRQDKIFALRESLRSTGFWDNVVARLDDDGRPEIAYGHHRLHALREEYPPEHEVDLIIKELSNDDMLKIMARENMEEWESNALIDMETARAALDAYAAGQIKDMPQPPATGHKSLHKRYAQPINCTDCQDYPYNSATVAEYLGWMIKSRDGKPDKPNVNKAQIALRALGLVDDGLIRPEDFDGFNPRTAAIVSAHAADIKKQSKGDNQEARTQIQQVVQHTRNAISDGSNIRDLETVLRKNAPIVREVGTRRMAQDANTAMLKLAAKIEQILDDDDRTRRLVYIGLNQRKKIDKETFTRMDSVLLALIDRANELREALHGTGKKNRRKSK